MSVSFNRLWLITLSLIFPFNSLWAQPSEIDSLKVLVSKQTGTKKIDALNALAFRQILVDFKEAYGSIDQAMKLSVKENYARGLAEAHIYKGICENQKGNKKEALQFLQLGILQARKEKIHRTEGYGLTQMGNIYRGAGKYDSANYWYTESFEVLKDSLHPWELSVLYRNLSRYYNLTLKPQLELSYLLRALRIREQLKDKVLLTDAYVLLSQWYINQSNSKEAIAYLNKAEKLNVSETLTEIRNDINYQKAVIYFRESRFKESLELLEDVKKFYVTNGNLIQYSKLLLDLADILEEMGSYDLSLSNCFEALKIAEEKRFLADIVQAQLMIGRNYMRIGRTSYAREFADTVLATSVKYNLPFYEGAAYNLKGLILQTENNNTEALPNYEKGYAIRKSILDKPGMAASLNNIGEIYAELGDLKKALAFQIQSETIAREILNLKFLCFAQMEIGKVYLKQQNLVEAQSYLAIAEKTAKQIRSTLSLEIIYAAQRELFKRKGELKEALRYSLLHEQLKDSISASSITNRVLSLQSMYELAKKKQEIELLKKNKQGQENQLTIQKAKIQQQQLIIVAILLGLTLVGALAYLSYKYYRKTHQLNVALQEQNEEIQTQSEELSETNRSLQKVNMDLAEKQEEIQAQAEELTEANQSLTMLNMELAEKSEEMAAQSEELKESNQVISSLNQNLESKVHERTQSLEQAYKELDTFFYRSSHDFRRPLTTFMGLAEVAKITVKDAFALDLFDKVKETAVNLDRMLIKLQSISDVAAEQFAVKGISLRSVLDDACHLYHQELTEANIQVEVRVLIARDIFSYPAFLKIVVENLLENAIRFRNHVRSQIVLEVTEANGGALLIVQDNGIGIEEIYINRVFDMFFRGSEHSKGNGLGLYIVKKAVEKMKGHVDFESKYGQGSRVLIWLPFSLI